MAANKFHDLGEGIIPTDPKMIKDLEVDQTYTISGKEENYTKYGILPILKVQGPNENEFRLYSTYYLNFYWTTAPSIVDGVEFVVKLVMGVKVPRLAY